MNAADPELISMVERAQQGDKAAWDEIVDRFSTLVWSVCHKYRLSEPDAEDVGGTVWLRLIENLAGLREPAALPGWLATTTARACIEVYRRNKRQIPRDTLDVTVPDGGPGHEHRLLLEEQQDALRAAFARLGDRCRQLLQLLFAEPPVAYAQVSSSIGIPVGAIGPTRRRCLAKLRSDPVLLPFQPSGGDRP
jgi:RNA polymerase sigma factor (sigma-70 family)